jgi:cytosine/adenosine deaminase-related metal-dependent hydrolase
MLAGAWKNLLAGVTSVVHHDRWDACFDGAFPLRVVRLATADSLGMIMDLAGLGKGEGSFGLHVAEGVDSDAAEEVRSLDAMGLLDSRLLAVHGVGVDEDGIGRLRRAGAAIVWCPTSNLFLFGRTAPPALFSANIDVLLGSDSLLTGAGDLLDELRAARALGRLDDAGLEAATGSLAARRLGLAPPSLEPGARADLMLVTAPLLEAHARHVVLVIANGIPRVASPDVARQFGSYADRGRRLSLRRVTRWASTLDSTADRIAQ